MGVNANNSTSTTAEQDSKKTRRSKVFANGYVSHKGVCLRWGTRPASYTSRMVGLQFQKKQVVHVLQYLLNLQD